MKYIVLKCFILLLLSVASANSAERVENFFVKVMNDRVKVTSAENFSEKINVVIFNDTLSFILGKITNSDGTNVTQLRVESQKSKSISVIVKKGQKLYFVPLSPPFQTVELIFGKSAYEIPPSQ